jgi:hypothetical protein
MFSALMNQEDDRKLVIFHYAGHGILKGDEMHLAASLDSNHSLHYETAFAPLWVDIEDFTNVDVI